MKKLVGRKCTNSFLPLRLFGRYHWIMAFWCAFCCAGSAVGQNTPRPFTPNIVLIVADDLGLGDIEAFGGKVPTPSLNRLIGQGMTFRDAHAPASHCSPSRAAILTGSNLYRMDLRYGSVDPDVLVTPTKTFDTLADVVKGVRNEDGSSTYATSFIGKMHLGEQVNNWPKLSEHGYDQVWGLPGGMMRPVNYIIDGDGNLITDNLGTPWSDGVFNVTREEIAPLGAMHVRQAAGFIEQHSQQPFLLHYNSQAVHGARLAPNYFTTYDGKQVRVLGSPDLTPEARPLGDDAAMIKEFDLQVGYILDALDANGLTDNTLVMVTSDNGGFFGLPEMENRRPVGHSSGGILPNGLGILEEIRGTKSTAYEGGVRIPFIARFGNGGPNSLIRPGSINDQLISINDVMGTLYDLTGQAIPLGQAMDSVSLLPTFFDTNRVVRDSAYIQAPAEATYVDVDTMKGGWRMDDEDGEWVLLFKSTVGRFDTRYPEALIASEFYNLTSDLSQSVNLLETPIRIDEFEHPFAEDLLGISDVAKQQRVAKMISSFFGAWGQFDARTTKAVDYSDPMNQTPIPGVRGPVLGDTNGDAVVDLSDLNNVRNNFGGVGVGDADGDGIVGLNDLNLVRLNFGVGLHSGTSVPEPSALVLFCLAMAASFAGGAARHSKNC